MNPSERIKIFSVTSVTNPEMVDLNSEVESSFEDNTCHIAVSKFAYSIQFLLEVREARSLDKTKVPFAFITNTLATPKIKKKITKTL